MILLPQCGVICNAPRNRATSNNANTVETALLPGVDAASPLHKAEFSAHQHRSLSQRMATQRDLANLIAMLQQRYSPTADHHALVERYVGLKNHDVLFGAVPLEYVYRIADEYVVQSPNW